MSIGNRLPQTQQMRQKQEQSITYEVNGNQVTLTPQNVRDYLVSGDKERVTIQELVMFINLCKFSGLNPWLKEAHCIKYGNAPATMVVGKDAFLKRAENHPAFDGCESGIIVINPEVGVVEYRKGCFRLPCEDIVGGWAEVWRKDRTHSTRIEVAFDEYVGRKKDGSVNAQWSEKPGTMIRKVAQVQALRESFPNNFGGMYSAEEQGVDESSITFAPDVIDQAMEAPAEVPQATPQAEAVNTSGNAQAALFGFGDE